MPTQTSTGLNEIAMALAEVQRRIKPVSKDSRNPHLQNKYASLGNIWDTLREAIDDEGLSVVQSSRIEVLFDGDGHAVAILHCHTRVLHTSGQWIEPEPTGTIISDAKGLNDPQQMGVAFAYCRRYALSAFFGIVSEEDTDGSMGEGGSSRQQAARARQDAARKAAEEQKRKQAAKLQGSATEPEGSAKAPDDPNAENVPERPPFKCSRELVSKLDAVCKRAAGLSIGNDTLLFRIEQEFQRKDLRSFDDVLMGRAIQIIEDKITETEEDLAIREEK